MLQRNVQRTMDIVFQFLDIAAFLNSLFTWQYPLRSVIGLVVYVIIGLYCQTSESSLTCIFSLLLWDLDDTHVRIVYTTLGSNEATHSRRTRRETSSAPAKENTWFRNQRQGQHIQGLFEIFAAFHKQLKFPGNLTKMSKWPRSTCVEFRTSWQCVPLACSILIKSGNSCTAHYYSFTLFNSITSYGFILGIQQGLSFILAS